MAEANMRAFTSKVKSLPNSKVDLPLVEPILPISDPLIILNKYE